MLSITYQFSQIKKPILKQLDNYPGVPYYR